MPLGPNYFNKVCSNLRLDGKCRYEQERVIPAWLKERITNQIGAMDVFSEEYSGGYDDALNWVLSLEE